MSEENRTEEEKYADLATKKRQELEVLLQNLRSGQSTAEMEEQVNAAKSPMALVFELIGCEFWRYDVDNNQDKNIPSGQFVSHPCIFGKAHPDQDCRTCTHVQYGRYGSGLPMYERRYANHGVVIPISDEEMDDLGKWCNEKGLKPTTRVQSKIHAVEQFLEAAKANEEHAARVAREAQQRGQRG